MGRNRIDLIGQSFGSLTVLSFAGKDNRCKSLWICQCECGNKSTVRGDTFKTGHTSSCGCLKRKRSFKHGYHETRAYGVWESMIQRCCNQNNIGYPNYGGRGIAICERWRESFNRFLEDMGECPEGMSIDRIDNDSNYEPGNCRWSTSKEQNRNKRSNILLTYGCETRCLKEWTEITGIPGQVIRRRLARGWTMEQALTVLVRRGRPRKV